MLLPFPAFSVGRFSFSFIGFLLPCPDFAGIRILLHLPLTVHPLICLTNSELLHVRQVLSMMQAKPASLLGAGHVDVAGQNGSRC